MHNGALKKWALALTFWLALHTSCLKAQIIFNSSPTTNTSSIPIIQLGPDTTSNPVSFEFGSDGTLIAKGNIGIGNGLSGTDVGAGTRLLWYPALGAFRAGGVSGSDWNVASIGEYSIGLGYNAYAKGYGSIAVGYRASASGNYSTASGYGSDAIADFSTASGPDTQALAPYSLAWGTGCVASGTGSVALGFGSASGYASVSIGLGLAVGDWSTASGYLTTAVAYNSFALGRYNVGTGNPTTWNTADPLFEVGNGTSSAHSDALLVRKDGSAVFSGPVTVPQSGDIPMYTGN